MSVTGQLASHELRTLQLAPLWMLSTLAGTTTFSPPEREAFCDAVVEVTLRTPAPARDIMCSLAADRPGLLLDFELDHAACWHARAAPRTPSSRRASPAEAARRE